jgi:hypothetical protein
MPDMNEAQSRTFRRLFGRTDSLSLSGRMTLTGTVAYKYAKETRIPHKRHWVKLAELVGVSGT